MARFPTKVLLATDGSEDATLAARAAVEISKRTGSELYLAHVWHFPSLAYANVSPEVDIEVYDRYAEELLAEQVERVKEVGGEVAGSYLPHGSPANALVSLATEIEAGLIVMGSRGLGPVKRLVLGSVSEGVAHQSSCPVLVVRGGQGAWPPERVVVGEDGSEAAKGAGELAASIGRLFGARGLLVRIYPRLPEVDAEGRKFNTRMVDDELRREERALEGRATEVEEYLGARPKIRIAVGDAAAANLLEAAEEDAPEKVLIAVGSRGLGAISRMRLGSVSTKVLHAAKGPILVHPQPQS